MRKVFLIFLLSFILNVVWENLHSFLYVGYMGDKITEFILLRASVADAVIITLLSVPFMSVSSLKAKSWLIIFIGVLVAIFIELYALNTGRWAYNEYMPIIPILGIGLTPTIQLGLLGYLSYRSVMGKNKLNL
ncbi:MAG: hypothetical protein Q8P69_01620 [bacterium]|nr:hypothetical protein [bacterium]